MKTKRLNIVLLICLFLLSIMTVEIFADNTLQNNNEQILIAQQPKSGLWDTPKDMPTPIGVQSGTIDISSAPDNDIRIILSDIARKTKQIADLTIDKTDDTLTPIKPVGEVASHGGGGELLNQWAKYWENLSKGLDMSGNPIPRRQWRSMFEGADKLKQWQQYREWFASQTDKLQRLATAISIVDSGSKVAGALWEGEGKLAAITLADEVCKIGTITFGTLFGAPWGPVGAIAGAFASEELWRKLGSPKFEQRAQFVKNMEIWNKAAGDIVKRKIGSLPEFDAYMEGKISEAEFRVKIREYAEKYKKENEEKKKQHRRELELLRKQAQTEHGLKELIDAWQDGKLPKSQKPLLVEALRRAIRAEKGASLKAGDEFECKIDAPQTPSSPTQSSQKTIDEKTIKELYGCICWCTINPTVGVGAVYDPNPWKNASPSCDDSRYGPCVGFGLGCWRQHMNASGECFERCIKNIGGDTQKIKQEIDKMKLDAFNDFIKEARGIIEEYISKIVPSVYRKKISLDRGVNYPLFAQNTPNSIVDLLPLYVAAAAPEAPMTYIEMIKEKNRRGDPDKALGLVKAAESIIPERKGELQNVLAEFAIIMSKASLNIVTELEFDDGLYLLRKAGEFHKAGESNALRQEIKRLIGAFEVCKKHWETLRAEVPKCIALVKDKRVCECNRLKNEKIAPASNGLDIREQASVNKWEISRPSGTPRPIPQKDKLMADLKQTLEPAKQKCASHPAINSKDMAQLKGYEQYKSLDKSPYVSSEDLRKSSVLPISDEQAVSKAEKILAEPGLCDCERDRVKGILDTAREDLKNTKLEVELTANKKTLTLGEYVRVYLSIKNGRKPYSYTITGDMTASNRRAESGLVTEYPPKTPGSKTVKAVVTDAAGDSRMVSVSFDVLPPKGTSSSASSGYPGSGPAGQPVYDPTKDPGFKGGGGQVDIASVDKAGKDFQDTGWGAKKTDEKAKDSQVTTQSDAYTDSGKKQGDGKEGRPPYPPYTPYPPYNPDSYGGHPGVHAGKNWTDLSGGRNTSSNWGGSSGSGGSGGGWTGSGSSASSISSTGSDSSSGSAASTTKTSPPKWFLTVVYENMSDTSVHIFTEGGETFSPNNLLAPGEKRNVSLIMPPDGRIKFISGRNGQVISSKYWNGDPNDLYRYPMVRFVKGAGGKEELSITTNLK